ARLLGRRSDRVDPVEERAPGLVVADVVDVRDKDAAAERAGEPQPSEEALDAPGARQVGGEVQHARLEAVGADLGGESHGGVRVELLEHHVLAIAGDRAQLNEAEAAAADAGESAGERELAADALRI